MRAMYDKAPGRHRHEIFQRRLDPVLGLDGIEDDGLRSLSAGRVDHQLANQRLIGRFGEMRGDIPASVRPLALAARELTKSASSRDSIC